MEIGVRFALDRLGSGAIVRFFGADRFDFVIVSFAHAAGLINVAGSFFALHRFDAGIGTCFFVSTIDAVGYSAFALVPLQADRHAGFRRCLYRRRF